MVIDFAFRHHSLYLWGANYSTTGCQCSGKAWWLPHLTRLLNRRTKYKRSGESARSAGRNQETGTYGRFIPTRRLVSRLQSISKFNFTPDPILFVSTYSFFSGTWFFKLLFLPCFPFFNLFVLRTKLCLEIMPFRATSKTKMSLEMIV